MPALSCDDGIECPFEQHNSYEHLLSMGSFAILQKMRLAALFLLLFMAIDLGSACTCEDETIDIGGSGTQSMTLVGSPNDTNNTDFSHECFCCCQHIRPQQIVHVDVVLSPVEVVRNRQPHTLNVAPASLYHPPRVVAL
jgi:hypothetical protein